MTTTIEDVETAICEAQEATNTVDACKRLHAARELLASAALEGIALDPKRIEALVLRIGEHTKEAPDGTVEDNRRFIKWATMAGVLVDYMDDGMVPMADGRVATPNGWDYSRCEPEVVTVVLARETHERLMAHAMKRLEEGTLESLRETIIETAVKEYLARQE